MEFAYISTDSQSRRVKGYIEARNLEEAVKKLTERGLTPLSVKRTFRLFGGVKPKVKRKELILFTIQFHSILSSGVPLTVGLESLSNEASSKDMKKVIEEIRTAILEGSSIYQAFSRFKELFPPYYLGALKVGEESGTLPKTLEKVIKVMEREEEQKAKTVRALIYPAFATFIILVAAFFYIFYVLPKVLDLVKNIGTSLPFLTKLLIAFVNLFRKLMVPLLIAFFAVVILILVGSRTEKFRIEMEKLLYSKLGLISTILSKSFYSQFTTFLALMLEAGVDMSTSLEILTFSTGSIFLKRIIETLRELVTAGSSLGQAFRQLNFPPLYCSMVSVGEETGSLPKQLNNLSLYYETEVSRTVERLQAIIEPVLIIIVGAFAAIIFISVLLPIYETIGTIR